jgi:ATP-binding cassette subfamily F protein 3
MESRDALERALDAYEGALVLITHDRHLIRSVAERIIEVDAGQVRSYEGDYELYLYRKEREAAPAQQVATQRAAPAGKDDARRRRQDGAKDRARLKARKDEVRRVERELERETAEMRKLEERLADPDFYTAPGDQAAEAVREHGAMRQRIKTLEDEWERASEELAALET